MAELEVSEQKFEEIKDFLNSVKKGKTGIVHPESNSGLYVFLVEGEPVVLLERDKDDSRNDLFMSDKLYEELRQCEVVGSYPVTSIPGQEESMG